MAVVTAAALTVLAEGMADDEMIYVRIKDPTGHRYAGKVTSILASDYKPTVDIEAEDGELVCRVPVPRIQFVDIRRSLSYPLMTASEFADAVLPDEP